MHWHSGQSHLWGSGSLLRASSSEYCVPWARLHTLQLVGGGVATISTPVTGDSCHLSSTLRGEVLRRGREARKAIAEPGCSWWGSGKGILHQRGYCISAHPKLRALRVIVTAQNHENAVEEG